MVHVVRWTWWNGEIERDSGKIHRENLKTTRCPKCFVLAEGKIPETYWKTITEKTKISSSWSRTKPSQAKPSQDNWLNCVASWFRRSERERSTNVADIGKLLMQSKCNASYNTNGNRSIFKYSSVYCLYVRTTLTHNIFPRAFRRRYAAIRCDAVWCTKMMVFISVIYIKYPVYSVKNHECVSMCYWFERFNFHEFPMFSIQNARSRRKLKNLVLQQCFEKHDTELDCSTHATVSAGWQSVPARTSKGLTIMGSQNWNGKRHETNEPKRWGCWKW